MKVSATDPIKNSYSQQLLLRNNSVKTEVAKSNILSAIPDKIVIGSTEDQIVTYGRRIIIPRDRDTNIDCYGCEGEQITIDIQPSIHATAIEAEICYEEINDINLKLHNLNSINFVSQNKYVTSIKNLTVTCPGIICSIPRKITIENLDITTEKLHVEIYGNVENLSIKLAPNEDAAITQQLLEGVNIIPGCGEYILNIDNAANCFHQLKSNFPNIKWISPVVAWLATDLDIKNCQILPGIDNQYDHAGQQWSVAGYNVVSAHQISRDSEDNVNYGGSIDDKTVLQCLDQAKRNSLSVMFYPMIMVDKLHKPWRGMITGNAEDVEAFYAESYEPFILHYANLVQGNVEAFIIGSELVGLTSIHTAEHRFPFIEKLITLSQKVKEILGHKVKVTYAADWSEYHSVNSSGNMRPLDALWASKTIDFVGINAYFPLTDINFSDITIEQIKNGWNDGEGIAYYYNQGECTSFSMHEPWTQWKNLEYWWNSEHWGWDPVMAKSIKTQWIPRMKPIWFTEFGFQSIDKTSNPIENGVPRYSSGQVDYNIQRRALRAALEVWKDSNMVQNMICWAFDVRGDGWNQRLNTYADGNFWQLGHWIDGKIGINERECLLDSKIDRLQILNLELDRLRITADINIRELRIMANALVLKHNQVNAHKILLDITGSLTLTGAIERYSDNIDDGQRVVYTTIIADECNLNASESCLIEGAHIVARNLLIKAQSIDLKPILVSYMHTQTVHHVKINAHTFSVVASNRFDAEEGSELILKQLDMRAANVRFAGIKLE